MQPHNHMLDMYRKLTGEVVDRAAPVLAKSPLIDHKGGPAPDKAKTLWRPVPGELKKIDTTLTDLGETIFAIAVDNRLNEDTRAKDISAAADRTRSIIQSATEDVLDRVDRILEITKAEAYPSRPLPADAIQEAALAGLKGDLRMVWDSAAGSDEIVQAMVASLRRAIGEGDALTTWLIASTHWPEDYLTSRGEVHRRDAWPEYVASELDATTPPALAEARRSHKVLADGRYGLPLFTVLFAQLSRIVDDVAGWRPTSVDNIPPTRLVG